MEEIRALVKDKAEPGAIYTTTNLPPIGPRDVLVKVEATAVCGTDVHIYDWTPYAQARVKPPMVFGHEFCGLVVDAGPNVTRVKVGDRIAGETHVPCEHCLLCDTGYQHICQDMKILGVHMTGAFAEYVVIPETIAWRLPEGTPAKVGAVLEPVGVGVHAAYSADVRGASVLVTGCGPIGLVAIRTAKALGAKLVIASDLSEKRLEMARQWGADLAVNPKSVDPVIASKEATHGLGVDVAIEASGSPVAIREALSSIRRVGQAVLFGLPGANVELDLVGDVIYKEATVKGITGREMWRTWYQVMDLIESGIIDAAGLVTHELPMARFEEGMAIAKSGSAGKVVLYP